MKTFTPCRSVTVQLPRTMTGVVVCPDQERVRGSHAPLHTWSFPHLPVLTPRRLVQTKTFRLSFSWRACHVLHDDLQAPAFFNELKYEWAQPENIGHGGRERKKMDHEIAKLAVHFVRQLRSVHLLFREHTSTGAARGAGVEERRLLNWCKEDILHLTTRTFWM